VSTTPLGCVSHLAQLLVNVASVDWQAAGRAERLAVKPGDSRNNNGVDDRRSSMKSNTVPRGNHPTEVGETGD